MIPRLKAKLAKSAERFAVAFYDKDHTNEIEFAKRIDARLAPLHSALLAVVEALQSIADNPNTGIYHDGSSEHEARQALAQLQAVADE